MPVTDLTANQLSQIICMNHIFYGTSAVLNVGSFCKEAVIEFEEIAVDGPQDSRGPFQKNEAHTDLQP